MTHEIPCFTFLLTLRVAIHSHQSPMNLHWSSNESINMVRRDSICSQWNLILPQECNPATSSHAWDCSMESNYSSCRIGSISLTLNFVSMRKKILHPFFLTRSTKTWTARRFQAPSSSSLWRSLCSVGLDHSLHRYCSWRTKVLRSFRSLLSVLHTYGTLPRKSMKASLRSYTCHGRLLLHHGPKLVLYNFFPSWLFFMCRDEAIHAIHVRWCFSDRSWVSVVLRHVTCSRRFHT